MKKIFLLATILIFLPSVAFAGIMPQSEMKVGGIGYGSELSYVKKIFGEPTERKSFSGDGVRTVTWIYSEKFSVTARTDIDDDRPEDDLPVVAFSLKDDSLATPGGITVGMIYNAVVRQWGMGEFLTDYDGRKAYFYTPNDSQVPMTLTFYVENGRITEIALGTDF